MPQVQKDEVRGRIKAAALETFAERGFRGATLGDIAQRAGVAVANVYRYYESKDHLFDAVLPASLAEEHERLLESSVRALATLAGGTPSAPPTAGEDLLRFWVANRHAVIVLLDRGEDTPYAGYGRRFEERLVSLTVAELRSVHPRCRVSKEARTVLGVVFDNTRRALAEILRSSSSERSLREAIGAFRTYQTAGLAALARRIATDRR